MGRSTALWAMVLFFAASLVFVGLRRLTEDQGAGVTVGAQLGALVAIVLAVTVVVRRMR
jgi:uncharacterized membrane protein YhaH (DUF805 family)